jgi:hypothetical protein
VPLIVPLLAVLIGLLEWVHPLYNSNYKLAILFQKLLAIDVGQLDLRDGIHRQW